jgi:hypothetical protein
MAWMSPYCQTSEGGPSGCFAAAIATAAAVVIATWTASSMWSCPGRWLSLALIGQAAALQLIDAGIRIHYQHYRLPAQAMTEPVSRWALVVVALQAIAVVLGLAARWNAIRAWMNSRRLLWLVTVLGMCASVAAAVSRDPRFFVGEACLAGFIQIVNAGNLLLAAWSLPPEALKILGRRFDSWLGSRDETSPASIDRFALLAALWVTTASALLVWFVYEHHPHVADEVTYLYNARYFATGRVVMPPPPVQRAFDVDLMDYKPDKWFGVVPLGWPAVLALGTILSVPWLVNPILAGLNVLLAYLFLAELYSRRLVRTTILLLCLSPWHIFVSMSYMTHTLTMTCALLGVLGVAWARRTGLVRWAWLAGIGVGVGSVIRPLDGLIVATLVGLWAIGLGGKHLKFPALAAIAAGTCFTGAIALPYNRALTGDFLASPLMQYLDEHYGKNSGAYGFGPDRGLGWATDAYPGHTPFEALINAELNSASLNADLFGWSTGSLLLIAVIICSGGTRKSDYLMLATVAVVVLAYAPYWGNGGPDFGARYWYLVLLPSVVLTARGMEWLAIKLGTAERHDVRAVAAVAALCGLALINYFPWRSLDKYHHYLRMRPDVQSLARSYGFGRSLVLIRGERFPDYSSAAIYNPINLQADGPVYAWDRDFATRAKVVHVYSDRPVWIVKGPTITKAGFQIVAGPLKPEALLSARSESTGH